MNRRALFGFLGIAPVASAGAALAAARVDRSREEPHDGPGVLGLLPAKEQPKPRPGQFTIMPGPDYDRELRISVGRDGALWVRPNGSKWLRVVTE